MPIQLSAAHYCKHIILLQRSPRDYVYIYIRNINLNPRVYYYNFVHLLLFLFLHICF
jgi:hypothetical protein